MPPKSLVRIKLKNGGLPGYHIKDPVNVRRAILMMLLHLKIATYSEMVKRINVLSIFNKNKNPKMSEKFKKDIKFLQKKAAPQYGLSSSSK